jgi:hypothetical protein
VGRGASSRLEPLAGAGAWWAVGVALLGIVASVVTAPAMDDLVTRGADPIDVAAEPEPSPLDGPGGPPPTRPVDDAASTGAAPDPADDDRPDEGAGAPTDPFFGDDGAGPSPGGLGGGAGGAPGGGGGNGGGGGGDGGGSGPGRDPGDGGGGTPAGQRLGPEIGLWVVAPDGTGGVHLGAATYTLHSWSPDSSMLVVKRYVDTLDLVAADGTWGRRLLDCPFGCDNPQWLPDGERISFEGWDGDVWLLRVADGSMERFALPEGTWAHVAWSRDGRVAWLEVDRITGESRLGVARVDGGDRRVVSLPREAGFPQFSPSGRYVGWHEGDDDGVFVYDTVAGGQPVEIRSPDSPVYDFDWDADDHLILSGNSVWAFDDALGRQGGRRLDWLGYAVDASADGTRTVWSRRPTAGFGSGGVVEVVTPDPTAGVRPIVWDHEGRILESPEWSPDGTHLAVWGLAECICTWSS